MYCLRVNLCIVVMLGKWQGNRYIQGDRYMHGRYIQVSLQYHTDTNSSCTVDKLEKTPETVDEKTNVDEKLSIKDSKQLNFCLEHPDFQEIQTNDTFIFDDFKKTQKEKANEDALALKTSGISLVRQEDGNLRVENCHVVDMEFSSDDQISPDVMKSGNEFCYSIDSSNVENEIVNNGREEKCVSRKATLDVRRSKET